MAQYHSVVKKTILISFCLFANLWGWSQCQSGNCNNGIGKMLIDSSIIYTGSFVNGLPDGKGVFSDFSGIVYDGEVKRGLYNGKGTLYYSNGDSYTGDFKLGLRHGNGRFNAVNGIVNQGLFFNNSFEGKTGDLLADNEFNHCLYTDSKLGSEMVISNHKVALLAVDNFDNPVKVFDLETGKCLARTHLIDHRPVTTAQLKLYLDFGDEFRDAKGYLTYPGYAKRDEYRRTYLGKTNDGKAIFLVTTTNGKVGWDIRYNQEIVTLANARSKASVIWKIKNLPQELTTIQISGDLKRIFASQWGNAPYIIDVATGNKTVTFMEKFADVKLARFSITGDSIVYGANIYSSFNGSRIGVLGFVNNRINAGAWAVSPDNKWYILVLGTASGSLACVADAADPNYILPLIDPQIDWTYIEKQVKYKADWANFQEERRQESIKKYDRSMAAKYGDDWKNQIKNNLPLPNNQNPDNASSKCPFCHGAGVVKTDGVKGIEQDKNGRWYNTYTPTSFNACSYCKGTGYIKR